MIRMHKAIKTYAEIAANLIGRSHCGIAGVIANRAPRDGDRRVLRRPGSRHRTPENDRKALELYRASIPLSDIPEHLEG